MLNSTAKECMQKGQWKESRYLNWIFFAGTKSNFIEYLLWVKFAKTQDSKIPYLFFLPQQNVEEVSYPYTYNTRPTYLIWKFCEHSATNEQPPLQVE